ncbi:sigma 54-interacting transcriptional regulator [Breoghania sp.]|uniref:sigma 54-interacting transcriptional regulator n=1 Tax=Breoghania sp. TaxID=2065378 RepID=UPI00262C938C|nr:sigma 54-interacting transcriptional regulator [Breoghania sp.]MDJ0932239.1 sigma 54-interacting transcriptional regulator [Breoghania sp.]
MTDVEFGKPPVLAVGNVLADGSRTTAIRDAGIALETASDGNAALAVLADRRPRILLLGEELADMSGVALLQTLAARKVSRTSVLVVSGEGALDANRVRGAYDFLVEPVADLKLVTALRNARERAVLHAAVEDLSLDMGPAGYFGLIGCSVAMRSVYRMVESVARFGAIVFITGESGTSKEVCAEAIHKAGPRASGPLVRVDCAPCLPTGWTRRSSALRAIVDMKALSARAGLRPAPTAARSLIREISALSIDLQEKFLKFLQIGKI